MEKHSREKIACLEIYTDGSLKRNQIGQTFGGWAFLVIKESKIIYMAKGHEYGTTNQRMELQAILAALEYARTIRQKNERIIIYSDSAYAINCYLQGWYEKWDKNGWITSTNKEVANKDLWFKIIPFFDDFWYSFRKVEGHTGNRWNEECDSLAQNEASFLKNKIERYKNYDT